MLSKIKYFETRLLNTGYTPKISNVQKLSRNHQQILYLQDRRSQIVLVVAEYSSNS